LAFRVRKGKQVEHQPDVPEVDVVEDDHLGQTLPSADLEAPITSTSKRKRDGGEASETPTNKRRKNSPAASNNDLGIKEKKDRYILFVGNLSYKTNKESIETHFASCPDPPTIRLLTPKRSNSGTTTTKSKGCAFLEFRKPPSLQHALKLHHSLLDGRRINVELTSGGGGSSEKRKEVIKARNRALEEERQWTRKSKQAKDENQVITSEGQRHSTTSGAEIGDPSKNKTWSVAADGEKAGRGGKRHMKKQQRGERGGKSKPKKAWAPSGANAVSVG